MSITHVEQSAFHPLLQVQTTGWTPKAPETSGQILLTLHRYAPDGSQDDAQGSWLVDTITTQ